MTTQTEALKLALEALEKVVAGWTQAFAEYKYDSDIPSENQFRDEVFAAIAAIKEALAQPEQKQNLKLMPREATPEMLKVMDECSTEGYDERLYEGHAGSVYMAAWDAFHGQHCYCGDITNLGVIHRDDGPCHYPEHTSEYKRGYADAMNWKVQNHLEHLPAAQPEQEPVACVVPHGATMRLEWASVDAAHNAKIVPLYTTPPQRKPLTDEELRVIENKINPTMRWRSSDEEGITLYPQEYYELVRAIEAAHGIKD